MSESDSSENTARDSDFDSQLRQLLIDQQPASTAFDQIWQRAQTRANQGKERTSLLQQFSQNSRVKWTSAAAAAVVILTLGILIFDSKSVLTNYDPVLLSDSLAPNDELFAALISSNHWAAPSDRFLKNQPELNIWGLPTITIPPPRSI